MQSNHPRGSIGHVLDGLRAWGIPGNIVDSVTVGNDTIKYNGEMFARFEYFDGIEQPLFLFQDRTYHTQNLVRQEDGTLLPQFRLCLSCHMTPGFEITGPEASPELFYFLRTQLFNQITNSPGSIVIHQGGGFFQGGSNAPRGEYFYLEFWKPKGAQAVVDFINQNYRPGTYDQKLVDHMCERHV